MTNLQELHLVFCSSLAELPSSIGNMTNLKELSLSICSSLVELPSSIGNMSNLQKLDLSGCSELKALPININMRSLDYLHLTGCSSLKIFPEISTNIRFLDLTGTAIEEVPPSIRSWSRLHELEIKGCTKLVSLPRLPDSLKTLDAENCESLERLDCTFRNTELSSLYFVNCFKLNKEARDLIINTWTSGFAVFPAETVPTYFTYRATGSSLSMKSNGFDTYFLRDSSFKACVLLVRNGDVGDWSKPRISCRIKNKLNGVIVVSRLPGALYDEFSSPLKEHLFVFGFEETVSSTELVFEFRVVNEREWEIKECGLRTLET